MRIFRAEVLARRALTPAMVRVTLGGPGLAGFASTGIADEYLRLFFPDPETGELVLPQMTPTGGWAYPAGKKPSHVATYTVRSVDRAAGSFDLDFVLHDGGRAASWAATAEPGDEIAVNAPLGICAVPGDATWMLLACDATGLPAASRLIETIHPSIKVRLIAEIAEPAHRLPLPERDRLGVTWLEHSGNGIAPSHLLEAVQAVPLPGGPGYVWVAAEQRSVRPIRRYFRHQLRLPAERYSATGYWTDRWSEWKAGWDGMDPALKARIEGAWASNRDRAEVADEVDSILDRVGI
ncbi:MAG: siderophore-interacting protein [Bauldia sp.]